MQSVRLISKLPIDNLISNPYMDPLRVADRVGVAVRVLVGVCPAAGPDLAVDKLRVSSLHLPGREVGEDAVGRSVRVDAEGVLRDDLLAHATLVSADQEGWEENVNYLFRGNWQFYIAIENR